MMVSDDRTYIEHQETLDGNGNPIVVPHEGHGFRQIEGFSKYVINRQGVVMNRRTFKILKVAHGSDKLRSAYLRKNGKTHPKSIENLLRMTFPEDYGK